jgi:hypothetical protein
VFFDKVTDYLDNECGYFVDEDNPFRNYHYYLEVNGSVLEFFMMHGQGTAIVIEYLEDKEGIDFKLIGNWDGFCKFIQGQFESIEEEKQKDE